MYRQDGHDIFVIDGHMHCWDANPENWKNKYGESWIRCFFAYHSALSPAEAVWPFEKFCRYGDEALVDDLFRTGYVDMATLGRPALRSKRGRLIRPAANRATFPFWLMLRRSSQTTILS